MLKAYDMMSRRNRRRHLQKTETVLDQFEDHLLGLLAKAREQQSRVRNYLTFEELEQRVRRKLLELIPKPRWRSGWRGAGAPSRPEPTTAIVRRGEDGWGRAATGPASTKVLGWVLVQGYAELADEAKRIQREFH